MLELELCRRVGDHGDQMLFQFPVTNLAVGSDDTTCRCEVPVPRVSLRGQEEAITRRH